MPADQLRGQLVSVGAAAVLIQYFHGFTNHLSAVLHASIYQASPHTKFLVII